MRSFCTQMGINMDKILDLKKTVYELYQEYPEMVSQLDELGFHDIVKPGMIQTAGRFMTIPKGAAMKKIEMEKIKDAFIKNGYQIVEGEMP